MREKKCKGCGDKFTPSRSLQIVCSSECAITLLNERKRIAEKKLTKARKDKIKSRSEWLREAQAAFNSFIRARDRNEPCISCQRHHSGQYHAGHYRSVGACPDLRFNELNNNKQCSACNNHLSGNIVEYRINLIKKIGIDRVEWLEGKHEPLKLTIDEIKALKFKYSKLARTILKEEL